MRISSFVISILIVGLIVTGFYSLVNTMASENAYGITVDSEYETSFDKTQAASSNITSDYEAIQDWSVDKTSFLALIPHALSLTKNTIKLPFSVTGDLIGNAEDKSGLAGALNLPDWVSTFMIAAIAAMIIFAFIALVLRYRYT